MLNEPPKEDEEKTYGQMWADFKETFYNEVIPKLTRFEGERVKYCKKRKISRTIIVSALLISFLSGISIFIKTITANVPDGIPPEFAGIVMTAVLIVFGAVYGYGDYVIKIKRWVLPYACSCFGKLRWYENIGYIGEFNVEESGLIPSYDHSYYDDVFKGEYKGVDFSIAEGDFERRTSDDKTTTCFRGIIVKIEMNKKFQSHTIVRHIKNFAGLNLGMNINGKKLEPVVLEDVDFMKKFKVLSTDQIEARYLLTSSFMQRLLDMKEIFKAISVDCAFYDKNLYIGLQSYKDFFSLDINVPVTNFRQYRKIFEEILSIYKIIDHFKLDEKTGL